MFHFESGLRLQRIDEVAFSRCPRLQEIDFPIGARRSMSCCYIVVTTRLSQSKRVEVAQIDCWRMVSSGHRFQSRALEWGGGGAIRVSIDEAGCQSEAISSNTTWKKELAFVNASKSMIHRFFYLHNQAYEKGEEGAMRSLW
jgi:hypothetical protein